MKKNITSLTLLALTLGFSAMASDEVIGDKFKCTGGIETVEFTILGGAMEEIYEVSFAENETWHPFSEAPTQSYVNKKPLRVSFEYLNDQGESVLRFESIDKTEKLNRDGKILSFLARSGSNNKLRTLRCKLVK